jgi:polysaccharide deacetylase 2 family uncharacterized protein YibQ
MIKRYSQPRKTAIFLLLSVSLLLLAHFLLPDANERKHLRPYPSEGVVPEEAYLADMPPYEPEPLEMYGPQQEPLYDRPLASDALDFQQSAGLAITPAIPPIHLPAERRAKIAIIIDDMGMDRTRSFQAIELPAPITLSFLPYAPGLADITAKAKAKGHELLLHMPMQPINPNINSGPMTIRSDMSEDQIELAMRQALSSFPDFVGVNNHMGSLATQDMDAMRTVMRELKNRGLFFIDSKTVDSSVAAEAAIAVGVAALSRDVFLDHQDTPAFVQSALLNVEHVAARKGHAIAIGHPKDATLEALAAWLPGLKARGFDVVPVSVLLAPREEPPQAIKVMSMGAEALGPMKPAVFSMDQMMAAP